MRGDVRNLAEGGKQLRRGQPSYDHRRLRTIAEQTLQLILELEGGLRRIQHVGGIAVVIGLFRLRFPLLGRFGFVELAFESCHGGFQLLLAEMHVIGVEIVRIQILVAHYRAPLVLGILSTRGSGSMAKRNARASALNSASAI